MEPKSLPAGGVLGDRVRMMDGGSIERFMSQVRENALEVLDFKRQWNEYEESMKLLTEHVVEVKKKEDEVEEREKEIKKKEEEFQLKQEAEAKEIEVKMNSLEAKEKTLEEVMRDLEVRKQEVEAEAKEIEVKRNALELKEKQLEEREELLEHKKRELDERSSKQAENHRKLYGRTSSELAVSGKGREMSYEVECIDDDEKDPEPYNCLDADFNNFNNTMNSFSVGQVWALYDPLDHMPRYYARIRKVLEVKVEVTWLEPKQTEKKPFPIACGEFKYGEKYTSSHLMFSHEMHHHIITAGKKKKSIVINPRKGETWAVYRDWKSEQKQKQKRPYRYDFVKVLSELDSVQGIGVAYLGRVEGFTSVYKHAPQHDCLQMMIPSDEMLRFSHRVPSFEVTGECVPDGSFELDPAAIPRDYLEEAFNVKKEEEEEEEGLLGLSLVQV